MKYIFISIFVALISGLIILFITGCAGIKKEIYLSDGQTINISAPTKMTVQFERDGSITIWSDEYKLNKNLIIEQ